MTNRNLMKERRRHATIRDQVIAQYGNDCYLCGATCVRYRYKRDAGTRPRNELTIDHVVPLAHGGEDTIENMAVACRACNEAKGDVVPLVVGRGAPKAERRRRKQFGTWLNLLRLAQPMGRPWL